MEATHLSPQAHQRLVGELELRSGARRREAPGGRFEVEILSVRPAD